MAQIKKIVRSNPVSNFTQVAPDGGATFRVLAEGLNALYDRVAPVAVEQLEQQGQEWGRQYARRDIGDNMLMGGAGEDTLSLIRGFEGFRETPYWDVNAHRLGYGSDTITLADGTVRRVKEGDRVTREDAERDLSRRVSSEFVPIARNAIGADRFDAMPENQKAAVTSIAYNYGEIPDRIVGALRSGDDAAAAAAIRALGSDNDGINEKRRNREADVFLSGGAGDASLAGGGGGVTIRTPDGSMQLRKYSPFAGPILRAHDAAARVAYQAETINQASISLQQLSQQYELDPDGYAQAAQSYVDELVGQAPAEVRGDLRSVLQESVSRSHMGIMDAKHRETRARANNASRALVERWSGEYAEALAAGDPVEIDAARRRLDNVLQAREALPGVAWTPEQSANVFLKAEDASQALMKRQRDTRSAEYKSGFELITDAAKAGRQAEGEELLQNPEAVSLHPELAREAAAFVALRDNTPDFLKMTPAQQAAEVARITAEPVGEEWEIDVADAAAKMAKENRKAWDEDPVKRAAEVLESPPPALPDLTPEDPSKFVAALAARREYMNRVRAAGYTDTNAFLSDEEAKQLGVLMGKGTDPAIRAAMSGAIVAGFGPDAVRVFDEIGGDRVTMFAGKMQALGGRPEVAQQILMGQQMIAENMVQLPGKADRVSAFDTQVATAMHGIPGALAAQAEVMDAAKALYASQAQGVDPTSEAASELMAQSIQTVLGQSKNKRGETTGGVQPVLGNPTLLPIGVSGGAVEDALRRGLGLGIYTVMGPVGSDIDPDLWAAAGVSGIPMINGEPIPRRYIANEMVRPVAIGGSLYRLELTNGSDKLDVEDGNGNVLIFDLMKFMEAAE